MKLTDIALRLSNHFRYNHLPGNILIGKHRIWPKLTPNYKRHLLQRIDTEIENMKLISRSYLTKEQEIKCRESALNEEKQAEMLELDQKKTRKRKMEDKYMVDYLKHLYRTKNWE